VTNYFLDPFDHLKDFRREGIDRAEKS